MKRDEPTGALGLLPRASHLAIRQPRGYAPVESPMLRMVATDYDPQMVRTARRSLRSFGDRADVQRADASDLPFADGRFDLVLSAVTNVRVYPALRGNVIRFSATKTT